MFFSFLRRACIQRMNGMSLSHCPTDLTDPSAVAVGKQGRMVIVASRPSTSQTAMPPILAIGSLPVLVIAPLTAIQGVHGPTVSKLQRLARAVTPRNVLSDSLKRKHGSGRDRAEFEIPGQAGKKSQRGISTDERLPHHLRVNLDRSVPALRPKTTVSLADRPNTFSSISPSPQTEL